MADNNGDSSATTILVTIVIVAIIGLAFYFGYARSHWGDKSGSDVNIELNAPDTGTGGTGN